MTAAAVLRALPDWRAVVVGVVVGGVAGAVALDTLDAVLLGVTVAAAVLVVLALDGGEGYTWPPDELTQTDGTRRDISSLTWSFVGRDGRVSENAVKHLQVVATGRLARRGVVVPGGLRDLAFQRRRAAEAAATLRDDGTPDPGAVAWAARLEQAAADAEALLGQRAWRFLGSGSGALPSLRDVAHCVDVLERLGEPAPATSPDADPAGADPDPDGHPRPTPAPERTAPTTSPEPETTS